LEHALDELALLAHFAHAIEELHLDGIALGALGKMEQRVVDILEKCTDQAIDAFQGDATDEFQKFAEAILRTLHATLALLEFDDLAWLVFWVGHDFQYG